MRANDDQVGFGKKLWRDIEPSAVIIIGEYARFFLLFAGTAFAYALLLGLKVMGVPSARIQVFEDMDYWVVLVVLAMFLVNLVLRVFLILFVRTTWR
jgi:hypothetical protein